MKCTKETEIKCTQSHKMIETRGDIERNEMHAVKMGSHTMQCISKVIGFSREFAH